MNDTNPRNIRPVYRVFVSAAISGSQRELARTIAATFERRKTEIPAELPDDLTPAFAEDEQKHRQWNVFLENVNLHRGGPADVIDGVAGFIMPHAMSATKLSWNGRPFTDLL